MLDSRRHMSPARTFGTVPDTSAKFGEITAGGLRPVEPEADFVVIAQSPEFTDLRSTSRKFTTRVVAVVLVSYLGYVAACAYVPQFMSTPLSGVLNIGLMLMLAQFTTALLITALYARFASKQLDPRADAVHDIVAKGSCS